MQITINHIQVNAEPGDTILDAAKRIDIHIPTLCHMEMDDLKLVNQVGTCRVCMVEVEGRRNLAPACSTPVTDGMVVYTATPKAIKSRRMMVELLLSNHPKDCLICERNGNCELQALAAELGVREIRHQGAVSHYKKDTSSLSLVRNQEKCVLCRRCETMCNMVQTVGVYSCVNRGFGTVMGTAFHKPILETTCTFCGQCVSVCPTGALTEKDNTTAVWDALHDPDKIVIAQTAPAVRVALGEPFGFPAGTRITGKMVAALRRMGFDKVFDTDFAADLTIMEEASELIQRLQGHGRLPLLTSCCPAWVNFIEHQFPDLLDIPSSCKSPHEMFGAIAKTYLAEKLKIDASKIVVVSVMPCIAKKYEAARPELRRAEAEQPDVDIVISTRELARMIREAGISFEHLPDEKFDPLMGEASGAGVIFGATGGVIEAALRTAHVWVTGEKPPEADFWQLRGIDGIREADVRLGEQTLKIAIAHGLGNARQLLQHISDGTKQYHAIEIMACPGGCIAGGGQPYHHHDMDIIRKRMSGIFDEDKAQPTRYSHENPEIVALYDEFLGEPYGEKAHELLHTSFSEKAGV